MILSKLSKLENLSLFENKLGQVPFDLEKLNNLKRNPSLYLVV
jgi:hypothetical protein